MERSIAHLGITEACIYYILSCPPLKIQPLGAHTYGDIVKRFHDFIQYVYAFWTHHLSESFREISSPGPLKPEIQRLASLLRRISPILSPTHNSTDILTKRSKIGQSAQRYPKEVQVSILLILMSSLKTCLFSIEPYRVAPQRYRHAL